MLLVAPLRHNERSLAHLPAHLERDDYLRSLAAEPFAYLRNRREEQFLVGLVELTLVFERETLVYRTVFHVYEVDESVAAAVVVGYAEHVDVSYGVAHNLALGTETLYEDVLLFQRFRLLKLHLGCLLHHLRIYGAAYLARVSLQNLLRLLYVGAVVLPCLTPGARRVAVVYVVFQAWFVFVLLYSLLGYRHAARAGLVELLYKVEYGIHACQMTVWSVECAELAVYLPCLEYSRQIFVGYADAGVGLSILQQNVVARVVFLYQTVLQQQSIFLSVHHRVADVSYLRDEHLCLEPVYLLMEIGGYALLQTLCLAHVYYDVVFIIKLIAPRLVGHAQYDALQSLGYLLFLVFVHDA